MSDIAIRVSNLSKCYRIGLREERHEMLLTAAGEWLKSPFRNFRRLYRLTHFEEKAEDGKRKAEIPSSSQLSGFIPPPSDDVLWALRDVSFEVRRGEVLGIIGRNGAGKSTLLKILSRITEPTTGRVEIWGRVASLLEVGTGFHPELTGRENVYLNGTILGMTKAEIEKKFDEIVDFSGVEKFIDTPVKRYSSGMRVRLAFAVAAHLDPEILVIDEVLAVGDVEFQKKCLGKMSEVARAGRTVLFVSHNLSAVNRLCHRALLIADGRVVNNGSSADIIDEYVHGGERDGREGLYERVYPTNSAPGNDTLRLRRVRMGSEDGRWKAEFRIDEGFTIDIEYEVLKNISDFHLYARVYTGDGTLAFCSADWDKGEMDASCKLVAGWYRKHFTVPGHLLNSGIYTLTLLGVISEARTLFEESNVLSWRIDARGGAGGARSVRRPGIFRPVLSWEDVPRVKR